MLFIIFILLSIIFTNIKAGFLSLVPNIMPVVVNFGIMGIFSIPLNVGTATLPEAGARDTAVDNSPLFKQFSDHLDLNLNISYFHYLTTLDNHDSNEGEVQLKFKTWGGVEKHSFHLEGWVEYGTQDNTYAGVTPLWKDQDRERAILEIGQVYGLFDLNGIGVTVGKKIIPNNTNSIYPLSQVYHPLDLNEPADPRF